MEILEKAFIDGVKLFIFSNPNNPVGCIYSYEEICGIASLAKKYDVTLIVDELYSRQIYPGMTYTHLCAQKRFRIIWLPLWGRRRRNRSADTGWGRHSEMQK